MVQIPKFWCLKSCTNIWPSLGNIYSVPKVVKIESEGMKGSKPAKICTFYTLQKIKIAFSQKTYETFHILLTNILKQDMCDWRDARVAWGQSILNLDSVQVESQYYTSPAHLL